MTRSRLLAALLLTLPLAACTGALQRPTPAPVAAPVAFAPVPAHDNLNAVLWVQTSPEYIATTRQAYAAASRLLDRALAENWQALVPEERAPGDAKRPPAVIVDIDETVLDNSPYQARLVAEGGEYAEPTWDAWVEERKARPLPGVVEFARAAQARGITVIYLSNRAQRLQAATLENLRAVGLPVKDESVFLGLGTQVEGCVQRGSDKSCRRQLVARNYRVLMQFGDQLGDFVPVPTNTREQRAKLLADHGAWFGERWWMLPNPTYGSWEPALFGNDYKKPADVRRALKKDALRTER